VTQARFVHIVDDVAELEGLAKYQSSVRSP